jgi:hypothetical protein
MLHTKYESNKPIVLIRSSSVSKSKSFSPSWKANYSSGWFLSVFSKLINRKNMPNRTGDNTRNNPNLNDLIALSEAAKVSGFTIRPVVEGAMA